MPSPIRYGAGLSWSTPKSQGSWTACTVGMFWNTPLPLPHHFQASLTKPRQQCVSGLESHLDPEPTEWMPSYLYYLFFSRYFIAFTVEI